MVENNKQSTEASATEGRVKTSSGRDKDSAPKTGSMSETTGSTETNTTRIGEVDRPLTDERRKNDERDYKDDITAIDRHEDGSVGDKQAQDFLARQVELAGISPNSRIAESARYGTPAFLDETTDDAFVSDGGPTMSSKAHSGAVADILESAEDQIKDRLKRLSDKKNARTK